MRLRELLAGFGGAVAAWPLTRLGAPSRSDQGYGEEARMRYKPKSIDALHIALGGLPDDMRVEVGANIGVSAKTVGELRKVTAWPGNLVITIPQERYPERTVEVSKATIATCVSPKR